MKIHLALALVLLWPDEGRAGAFYNIPIVRPALDIPALPPAVAEAAPAPAAPDAAGDALAVAAAPLSPGAAVLPTPRAAARIAAADAPDAASLESLAHVGPSARELVRAVIQARDPGGSFKDVQAVRFPLKLRGRFFSMQGNEKAFNRDGVTVTVWTKKRKVAFENFPRPGETSVYLEDRAYTLSRSGTVLRLISRPLDRIRRKTREGGLALKANAYEEFEGGSLFGALMAPFRVANALAGDPFGKAGRLTALEQMSFMSYALINYMTFPNNLLDADKVESVEKTGPFELTVTYRRADFPTNSKVQVYDFDPKTLLLGLHRYRVSYIDKAISATTAPRFTGFTAAYSSP